MKIRVYIDDRLIKKLVERYEHEISKEFGIIPTSSQLVTIELIYAIASRNGQEVEIKIHKNGKITYKFR